MPENFQYDVFLSHSSKDKAIVRLLAERLRKDGVRVWFDEWEIRPNDSKPAKLEEGLEQSRVLVLCMSANASGSDWPMLERQTFRFRDPLNKDRRFVPLRLDDSELKDSLLQFSYVDWRAKKQDEYIQLREACRPPVSLKRFPEQRLETAVQLEYKKEDVYAYALSSNSKVLLTGGSGNVMQVWNVDTGQCLRTLKGHSQGINSVAWSRDNSRALSASADGTIRLWNWQLGICLDVLKGHKDSVMSVAWSSDQCRALSSSFDGTVRIWNLTNGSCLSVLEGHTSGVIDVSWSVDQRRALSASLDGTVRLWDIDTAACIQVLEGNGGQVSSVAWSPDQQHALTGSLDGAVRLWTLESARCLGVLEGHLDLVRKVAWSPDQQLALSASNDKTVRLWDVNSRRCLSVFEGHKSYVCSVSWAEKRAFSADVEGGIRFWDLSEFLGSVRTAPSSIPDVPDQVQYTNAKVLLVGDSSSGKTGLAHRLATGMWKASDGSTIGAWSTQWKLSDLYSKPDIEREIWLWDFGGQSDQRLIHQLYMDRAALILLLFNADQEEVLSGLRDWQTALRRCVPVDTPQFLVAGRIDAGFKASRGKILNFAKEHHLEYFETSAAEGAGCQQLNAAIMTSIPWDDPKWVEQRTSPRIFKLIKDEILNLRDEGQVLITFKELRELLWRRLPQEQPKLSDQTLHTVVGLLDGPGAVKELDYGTYILLQPEWINAYAQAVIRTLRASETELGYLPLRSIAEGRLVYQSIGQDGGVSAMKRLPPQEERIILGEMERQLLERGLCLKQGDKLVFPSHCGRERPTVVKHPSIFVSYAVQGYLDDIYATLVVKLADSQSFNLKELWRDAADFDTLEGSHRMGVKLTRDTENNGDISVYFGPGVTQEEQVIFANYIHAHLAERSEQVQRLRYYVCPKCDTPKGNPQVLMEKLLAKKQAADTECDKCGKRFVLWDALEKKFASRAIRDAVEGLKAEDIVRLDSRRKGKLLALEVAARITSADQKCFEIPGTEDEGLDIELEFTDDDGNGTGKRLYLQLKAGNSYLRKRKADGVEIFQVKKQRWVQYWLKQPHPVMLVVGTFGDKEKLFTEDKLEFTDVRWMEISSILKHDSENGKKAVKQIEFKGERLDLTSVRRLRDVVLSKEAAADRPS